LKKKIKKTKLPKKEKNVSKEPVVERSECQGLAQRSRFESCFQREETLVSLVFKEEKTKLPNKE